MRNENSVVLITTGYKQRDDQRPRSCGAAYGGVVLALSVLREQLLHSSRPIDRSPSEEKLPDTALPTSGSPTRVAPWRSDLSYWSEPSAG